MLAARLLKFKAFEVKGWGGVFRDDLWLLQIREQNRLNPIRGRVARVAGCATASAASTRRPAPGTGPTASDRPLLNQPLLNQPLLNRPRPTARERSGPRAKGNATELRRFEPATRQEFVQHRQQQLGMALAGPRFACIELTIKPTE